MLACWLRHRFSRRTLRNVRQSLIGVLVVQLIGITFLIISLAVMNTLDMMGVIATVSDSSLTVLTVSVLYFAGLLILMLLIAVPAFRLTGLALSSASRLNIVAEKD